MNSQLTIAAHVLAVLSHHQGDGAVTSDVLAKGFGTNPVVIRRVLSQLKRAGLIKTQRGVGGGSLLAKPASDITLRDAYDAVTSSDQTVLSRHPRGCDENIDIAPVIAEYLNELLEEADRALLRNLGAVSIADLTQEIGKRLMLPRATSLS